MKYYEEVDAIQWTGDNLEDVQAFCANRYLEVTLTPTQDIHIGGFYIAHIGQCIVFYPTYVGVMDMNTFRKSYKECDTECHAQIYKSALRNVLALASKIENSPNTLSTDEISKELKRFCAEVGITPSYLR